MQHVQGAFIHLKVRQRSSVLLRYLAQVKKATIEQSKMIKSNLENETQNVLIMEP